MVQTRRLCSVHVIRCQTASLLLAYCHVLKDFSSHVFSALIKVKSSTTLLVSILMLNLNSTESLDITVSDFLSCVISSTFYFKKEN